MTPYNEVNRGGLPKLASQDNDVIVWLCYLIV